MYLCEPKWNILFLSDQSRIWKLFSTFSHGNMISYLHESSESLFSVKQSTVKNIGYAHIKLRY